MTLFLQLDSRHRDPEAWPNFADYGVNIKIPELPAGVPQVQGRPLYDEWNAMPVSVDPDIQTETPTVAVSNGVVTDSYMGQAVRVLCVRAYDGCVVSAVPPNNTSDPVVLYSHHAIGPDMAFLVVGLRLDASARTWSWAYTVYTNNVAFVSQARLAYRAELDEVLLTCLVDVFEGDTSLVWFGAYPPSAAAAAAIGVTSLAHAQNSLQCMVSVRVTASTGAWVATRPSVAITGVHRVQTRSEFGQMGLAQDISGDAYVGGSWDPLAGAMTTTAFQSVDMPDPNPFVPGSSSVDAQDMTVTLARTSSFGGNTYLWVANAAQVQVWITSNLRAPRVVATFAWPPQTTTPGPDAKPVLIGSLLPSPVDALVLGAMGWFAFQSGHVWQVSLAESNLGIALTAKSVLQGFAMQPNEKLTACGQPAAGDPAAVYISPARSSASAIWFWLTTELVSKNGAATTCTYRLRAFAVDQRYGGHLVESSSAVFKAASIRYDFPTPTIPVLLRSWPTSSFASSPSPTGLAITVTTRCGLFAATNMLYPFDCAVALTDPVVRILQPETASLQAAETVPPAGTTFDPDDVFAVDQMFAVTGYMDASAALWQGASPNPYAPTVGAFSAKQMEASGPFRIDGWDLAGATTYASDPAAATTDATTGAAYPGPWVQLSVPSGSLVLSYTLSVVLRLQHAHGAQEHDAFGNAGTGFTEYLAPASLALVGSNDGDTWTVLDVFDASNGIAEAFALPLEAKTSAASGSTATATATVTVSTTRALALPATTDPLVLAQTHRFSVFRLVFMSASAQPEVAGFLAANSSTVDPTPYEQQFETLFIEVAGLSFWAQKFVVTTAVTEVTPPVLTTTFTVPYAPVLFSNLVEDVAVAVDPTTREILAAVAVQSGAFLSNTATGSVPNTYYKRAIVEVQLVHFTPSADDVARASQFLRGAAWSLASAEFSSNSISGVEWNYDVDGRWYLVVAQQTTVRWLQLRPTDWLAAVQGRNAGVSFETVQVTSVDLPDDNSVQDFRVTSQPVRAWFPCSDSAVRASVMYLVTPTYWSAVVSCPTPSCSLLDTYLPSPDGNLLLLDDSFPLSLRAAVHPVEAGLYIVSVQASEGGLTQICVYDAREPAHTRRVAVLDVDTSLRDAQAAWMPVPAAAFKAGMGAYPGVDPSTAGWGLFGLAQPDGENGTLQWWDATQTHLDVQAGSTEVRRPTLVAQANLGPLTNGCMDVMVAALSIPSIARLAESSPPAYSPSQLAALAVQTPVIVAGPTCLPEPGPVTVRVYMATQALPSAPASLRSVPSAVMAAFETDASIESGLEPSPSSFPVLVQTVGCPDQGATVLIGATTTDDGRALLLWQAAGVFFSSAGGGGTWRLAVGTTFGYDLSTFSSNGQQTRLDLPRSYANYVPSTAFPTLASWLLPSYYPGSVDTTLADGLASSPPYPNPARCQSVAHPADTGDVILSLVTGGTWLVWVWDGEVDSAPVLWSKSAVQDLSAVLPLIIIDLVQVPVEGLVGASLASMAGPPKFTLGAMVTTSESVNTWVLPPEKDKKTNGTNGGPAVLDVPPTYAELLASSGYVDPFTPVHPDGTDWWGVREHLCGPRFGPKVLDSSQTITPDNNGGGSNGQPTKNGNLTVNNQSVAVLPALASVAKNGKSLTLPAWTCAVSNSRAYTYANADAYLSLWVGAYSRAVLSVPDYSSGEGAANISGVRPCLAFYNISALCSVGADAVAKTLVPQVARTTVVVPPPPVSNAGFLFNMTDTGRLSWYLALADLGTGTLADQVLLGGLAVNRNLTGLVVSGSTASGGGLRAFPYRVTYSSTGVATVLGAAGDTPAWSRGAYSGSQGTSAWLFSFVPVNTAFSGQCWFAALAGFADTDAVHAGRVSYDATGAHIVTAMTASSGCSNVAVYAPVTLSKAGDGVVPLVQKVLQSPDEALYQTARGLVVTSAGVVTSDVRWSSGGVLAAGGGGAAQVCDVAVDPESNDWFAAGWTTAPVMHVAVMGTDVQPLQIGRTRCARAWFVYRFAVADGTYRSSSVRLTDFDMALQGATATATRTGLSALGTGPALCIEGAAGTWSLYCPTVRAASEGSSSSYSQLQQWALEPDGTVALCLSPGTATTFTWSTRHFLVRTGATSKTFSTLVVPVSLPAVPWAPTTATVPGSFAGGPPAGIRTTGCTDAYVYVLGDSAELGLNRPTWRARATSGPRAQDGRVALVLNQILRTSVLGRVLGTTGLNFSASHYTAHLSRSPVAGAVAVSQSGLNFEVDWASPGTAAAVAGAASIGQAAYAVPAAGAGSAPGLFPSISDSGPLPPLAASVALPVVPSQGQGQGQDLNLSLTGGIRAKPGVYWVGLANLAKSLFLAFNPSTYGTETIVQLQVLNASLPNITVVRPDGSGATVRLASYPYVYLQVYPTTATGATGTAILNNFFSNNASLSTTVLTFVLNMVNANAKSGCAFLPVVSPMVQNLQFDNTLTVLRLKLLDPQLQPLVFDNAADEGQLLTQMTLSCTVINP